MKMCTKCKRKLDESNFSKKGNGLNTRCRDCVREYDKQHDEKKRQMLKQGNTETENCVKCGKQINYEYKTDNIWYISKFCKECYPEQKFKDRTCEKCGNTFMCGEKPSQLKNYIVRKYCPDCSTMNQETKQLVCPQCGNTYYAARSLDGRHFRHQRVCPECSKPKEVKTVCCEKCGKSFEVDKYPGTNTFRKIRFCSDECRTKQNKTAICECCGKEFDLQRKKDGHFILRQYCSDECRLKTQRQKLDTCYEDRLKKTKQTCQEKYGVNYPIQINNVVSQTNLNFAMKLQQRGIGYQHEYSLGDYNYDFYLPEHNFLLEINPTFTHTCYDTGVYKPKDKDYHYNKTKFAIDSGYHIFNIWDWTDIENILNIIQQGQSFKQGFIGIEKVYSKGDKVTEPIDAVEEQELLDDGWLPIYDSGYVLIEMK